MDLSQVAQKLAKQESLTPEDVQLMQEAIRVYGVHNAAKLLDAQAAGLKAGPALPAPTPPQTPAMQEDAAMQAAFGTPQRMNA